MHTLPSDQETTIATRAEATVTISPAMLPRRITSALIFLSGCVALLMTGFGIIMPVFPQRLQALGLGAGTLALMEGAFGLGMFLFSTPMGTLADRIGRKPIVFLSLAGFIVTSLILAFVNIPLLFIVIRFVEGTLVSGLMPASSAMIGDSVPLEKQGRWIGFLTTAQATGIALGPGIGGFLYQSWGFTSPFLVTAGIAFVAALLALVMLPETLPAHVREKARLSRTWKASKQTRAQKTQDDTLSVPRLALLFAPLLIVDFVITFVYPFVLPQYPFYLEQVLKYDAAQYGMIASVYGLSLAVFPLLLGRLAEILPKRLLIVIGCLLYTALNVAMLLLHQYMLLILGAALTGLGSALLIPALGTIYLGATTDQNRSQVMGVRGSAISLGVLLGPLAQAAAGPWITPQATFAIGVGLSLAVTLLAFFLLRNVTYQYSQPAEA